MSVPFPRRVAIFIPAMLMGGAEKVMLELAYGWREKGIEVDFVFKEATGPLLAELPPGTHVEVVGQRGYARSIRPLARYLDARKPDVLVGALYINNVVAVLASKLARHRPLVVLTNHSSLRAMIDHPTGNKDRWLLRPLVRLSYPMADAVVAVSDGVARELERTGGLKPGSVRTLFNPIVNDDTPRRGEEIFDHRWLGDGGPPLLLSLGRLVDAKNLDVLLDALALIERSLRLIVAGHGPRRAVLEEKARTLGIADRVDFVGLQANPLALMARADLFVLSSRSEGLPTTLVEAMASGCPVVSTDCDFGPREILDGERFGWLAPVGNATALAATIEQALDAPAGDPRKDKARLRARADDFHRDRAVDAYLDLFRQLEAKRG